MAALKAAPARLLCAAYRRGSAWMPGTAWEATCLCRRGRGGEIIDTACCMCTREGAQQWPAAHCYSGSAPAPEFQCRPSQPGPDSKTVSCTLMPVQGGMAAADLAARNGSRLETGCAGHFLIIDVLPPSRTGEEQVRWPVRV